MISPLSTGSESFLHVFSFSGFIILDSGSKLEPCDFSPGAVRIIVEQPLRLASATWRPIPQFTDNNLKEIFRLRLR
jgi:hypothetical protein